MEVNKKSKKKKKEEEEEAQITGVSEEVLFFFCPFPLTLQKHVSACSHWSAIHLVGVGIMYSHR